MPDQTMRERVADQTPSTEDVRWKYRCMRVMDGAKDIAAQTEFNAWLAAHDRTVTAAALREAADNIRATWMRLEIEGLGNVIVGSPDSIARHLEARADRIEDER